MTDRVQTGGSDRPPSAAEPQSETLRSFRRSLPVLLLTAREAVMTYFRPMLRAHGLTEQQWRVLRALDSEGPVEAAELARLTSILPPSLSRILKLVERKGWITRRSNQSDLRRTVIAISAKGRTVIRKIAPEAEAQHRRITESFGAEEADALVRELIRLAMLKP
ncbi:MAG: homoprotocatechuate degradation operon regulator HpaR [Hyphomicrobiales bacterium]|nr:homoprotocatechuate degradation operon regulator HpaR [Hyphomicrobiales bacterium]